MLRRRAAELEPLVAARRISVVQREGEQNGAIMAAEAGYDDSQGPRYPRRRRVSAETVGARRLCMQLVTIPPGAPARAYVHESHEIAILVLEGEAELRFGESVAEHLVRQGDCLFIPAGTPHLLFNPGPRDPCVIVLARTDQNEQRSLALLRELDRDAA
jgi:uncharacterized RmlC-like cupin family protein